MAGKIQAGIATDLKKKRMLNQQHPFQFNQ
jgi:hypothetical protein